MEATGTRAGPPASSQVRLYEALSSEKTDDNSDEEDSDGDWLYTSSSARVFDDTLGSSPLGPESSIFYS
ncbi:hypothetical protein BGZ73_009040 [Actinomortierella ambigua]|nr:hypothetical protein BGZ73_009040 [Actinomortierella ambigua]